ncbi:protein kinase-like domain, concanavalin A-like lectin/glucanase domain protein [Tanacetum coccineum]
MENANPSSSTSNNEFLDPKKKIEIESWLEDSRIVDSLVGSDELEYFDTFPTLEELEYHEWLLKCPKPSWVKAKIRTENLKNIKISCMIGHCLKRQAYIDLESPINVMFKQHYKEIMNKGLESRQKPSNPSKNINFVGRVRGLKVFVGNFTYECNFMILEDTTSIIDNHLGEVVFGKPFVRKTGLVYDQEEGTVTFEKDNDKITFKMPPKMEAFNHINFMDVNTDFIPPFILENNDDHGKTYYLDSLILGPEYREDEMFSSNLTNKIACRKFLIKTKKKFSQTLETASGFILTVIFDKKKLGRSWDVFIGRLLEDDLTIPTQPNLLCCPIYHEPLILVSANVMDRSIGIDIPMLPLDDIRSGQIQFHLSQLRMSRRSISRIKSSSRHEVTIPNPVFRCSEIWGCDRLVSEPLGYRELGCIREMSQSLSSNVPDNSPEQEAATGHSIPRRLDSPTSQATQLLKLELTLTPATGRELSQEINNHGDSLAAAENEIALLQIRVADAEDRREENLDRSSCFRQETVTPTIFNSFLATSYRQLTCDEPQRAIGQLMERHRPKEPEQSVLVGLYRGLIIFDIGVSQETSYSRITYFPPVSPFPPTIIRTARISILPIEPNLAERARISAINVNDYQLDPLTPPPLPSSLFSMAAYQRMIAETDPTQREEVLTAYRTGTGQNSVPIPETALTVCTTRLRGQLHTILEDMDHYLNAYLEELEAFLTL